MGTWHTSHCVVCHMKVILFYWDLIWTSTFTLTLFMLHTKVHNCWSVLHAYVLMTYYTMVQLTIEVRWVSCLSMMLQMNPLSTVSTLYVATVACLHSNLDYTTCFICTNGSMCGSIRASLTLSRSSLWFFQCGSVRLAAFMSLAANCFLALTKCFLSCF
jgi:hypothetical protein